MVGPGSGQQSPHARRRVPTRRRRQRRRSVRDFPLRGAARKRGRRHTGRSGRPAHHSMLKPPIATPANTNFDGDWLFNANPTYLSATRPRVGPMNVTYQLYSPPLISEPLLNQADYYRVITPHQTPTFDSTLPFFYRDSAREYIVLPTDYYQYGSYFWVTPPERSTTSRTSRPSTRSRPSTIPGRRCSSANSTAAPASTRSTHSRSSSTRRRSRASPHSTPPPSTPTTSPTPTRPGALSGGGHGLRLEPGSAAIHRPTPSTTGSSSSTRRS